MHVGEALRFKRRLVRLLTNGMHVFKHTAWTIPGLMSMQGQVSIFFYPYQPSWGWMV